tara:strand:- start:6406 stop:7515 length:1110 start_codon:yes stop_codon:yes gene_type:complete
MATVTKSIGTSSRDYSTIAAWEADLDSSSIYSSGDDAVGELYADTEFNEDLDIDGGGTIELDSITLTSSSAIGNRHNGNKGTGAVVRRSSGTKDLILYAGNATVDTMTFSWIEFDGDDDTTSNGSDKSMVKSSGATELYIQNNIFHSWGSGQDSANNYTFKLEGTKNIFTNNFVFNMNGGSGHTWHVFCGNASTAREQLVLNNTFFDIDKESVSANSYMFSYMDTHASSRIRNNIILDDNLGAIAGDGTKDSSSVLDYLGYDASSVTGFSNVVEDTADNAFSSSIKSDPNLHLKAVSTLIDEGVDLGTSPTNVAIDIDGRDRDFKGDTWDLGADEYSPASITGKKDGLQKQNFGSRIAFGLTDPSDNII